ncbi:MAG TPA: hypothetical protein VMX18_01290 [Candidatus Bipolaricaulota bacterium]|nr:hypothetical protein [Candidatus Bipolaricaulota bacterium]
MTPKNTLEIVNGPGRWDMILAIFDGQPVRLVFEDKAKSFNGEFEISGGHFYGKKREVFNFSLCFPHRPGDTGGTFVTRKGLLNIDHLMEREDCSGIFL